MRYHEVVAVVAAPQSESEQALRAEVAALEAALAATKSELSAVTAERNKLRRAYDMVKSELELLRRRLFVAKAERIDTTQLEIEFAETKAKLDQLARALDHEVGVVDGAGEAPANENAKTRGGGNGGGDGRPAGQKKTSKGSGRPDLTKLDLIEERVEILDPALEGTSERIGFENTYLLGRRRACNVRVVMAKATYKTTAVDENGEATVEYTTAPKPREVVDRGMLAPSFIAFLLTKKYRWGMPFHRVALELLAEGISVDDSTMCRYAEHVGATFGCIVDAMWKEAKETAFCISTDATGCAIQPERLDDKPRQRQPCARGHFFVALADSDHVLFEFRERHTSDAVCEMFRGYKGYIQADAHCIYDALFRGDAVEEGEKPPDEVACWSHARRKAWEAAVMMKAPEAREALLRIRELFKREEEWKDLAPKQRYERRQRVSRPMLDDFFAWAEGVFERVGSVRGPLASAFGYVIRQRDALRRYLDDGRLRIDNNAAERALRSTSRSAAIMRGSRLCGVGCAGGVGQCVRDEETRRRAQRSPPHNHRPSKNARSASDGASRLLRACGAASLSRARLFIARSASM